MSIKTIAVSNENRSPVSNNLVMGYSRQSFLCYKKLYEAGEEASLLEMNCSKPIRKNRE